MTQRSQRLILVAAFGASVAVTCWVYGSISESRNIESRKAAAAARRLELLSPFVQAFRNSQIPGMPIEAGEELCPLADHRAVREDGNVEYAFHKCGWTSDEGDCSLYLVLDERHTCPVVVDAQLICPEW
jgi:hypothetical protein